MIFACYVPLQRAVARRLRNIETSIRKHHIYLALIRVCGVERYYGNNKYN